MRTTVIDVPDNGTLTALDDTPVPVLAPCRCGGEARYTTPDGKMAGFTVSDRVLVRCKVCGIQTQPVGAAIHYSAMQVVADTWNAGSDTPTHLVPFSAQLALAFTPVEDEDDG